MESKDMIFFYMIRIFNLFTVVNCKLRILQLLFIKQIYYGQ